MINYIVGGLILLLAGLSLRSLIKSRRQGGCMGCAQSASCPHSIKSQCESLAKATEQS